MAVVFTSKPTSAYGDLPGERYHVPRTYLRTVLAGVGDLVLYYEPGRRGLGDRDRTGRRAYVAVATLERVIVDPTGGDENFAFVRDYTEFLDPVPFRMDGQTLERGLQKDDGSTNKGLFGRAVRTIQQEDAEQILRLGLGVERPDLLADEDPAARRRLVLTRAARDRAFRELILRVYDKRCAITRLRLVNGGGAAEAQAAHVQAVAAGGPDAVSNGIALSQTVHWLFDRFSFTLDDDYRVVLPSRSPIELPVGLLRAGQALALPGDRSSWPHPRFLRWHQQRFEEKWTRGA